MRESRWNLGDLAETAEVTSRREFRYCSIVKGLRGKMLTEAAGPTAEG